MEGASPPSDTELNPHTCVKGLVSGGVESWGFESLVGRTGGPLSVCQRLAGQIGAVDAGDVVELLRAMKRWSATIGRRRSRSSVCPAGGVGVSVGEHRSGALHSLVAEAYGCGDGRVAGIRDEAGRRRAAEDLATALPNCSGVIAVRGAGHLMPLDAPVELAEVLLGFFATA